MRSKQHHKGFTLLELLVVISIITLLSSVILAAVSVARAKGQDAQIEGDVETAHTALTGYTIDKNGQPGNYLNSDGTMNLNGLGNAIAFEDSSDPTNPQTAGGKAYNQSMQQLVDAGELSNIPHSPEANAPFGYFDYGPGSPAGAMFVAQLPNTPSASGGAGGSCSHIQSNMCMQINYPLADYDGKGVVDQEDVDYIRYEVGSGGSLTQYDPSFDYTALVTGGNSNQDPTQSRYYTVSPVITFASGDVNGDGILSGSDVDIARSELGASCTLTSFQANPCSDANQQQYGNAFCACVQY